MNQQALSSFLWSVAALLRGDHKQSEYGRVVLPFTVLPHRERVRYLKSAASRSTIDIKMGPAVPSPPSLPVRGYLVTVLLVEKSELLRHVLGPA
jgi:type I restriction enzyme M protein